MAALELREVEELRTILARRARMMDALAGAVYPQTDVEAEWGCGESELPSAIAELTLQAKRLSVKLELRHEFRDMSEKQLMMRGSGAGLSEHRITHAQEGATPRESVMVMIMGAEKLHAESRHAAVSRASASALDSSEPVGTEAESVEDVDKDMQMAVDRLSASRSLLAEKQLALGADPIQALLADRDAATVGADRAKAVRVTNAEVRKVQAALKGESKFPLQRIIDSGREEQSGHIDTDTDTDKRTIDRQSESAQIEEWITEQTTATTGPRDRATRETTDRSAELYTIRVWGFGMESWDQNPKSAGPHESGAVYSFRHC